MVRIGSTSKLFTWTAVMQLVEQGKLDLDRNINDYLDFRIPENFGKPVTLRDLMNHRAGFEEGLKDVLWTNPHGVPSTEAYLKDHQRPMLFPPGQVPAYSNYGAALAGYIVERISKEPYERYIERHILVPLGMAHTSFDQPLPERFASSVSKGYRTASAPPGPYELIVTRPAGSGTTTLADMSRFMLAHLQDGHVGDAEILKADTAKLMHSPSEEAAPGFATMAHGFFREVHNGHTMIGHGGDTIYFHNEFELLPAEGVGIDFTFNSRGRGDAVYLAREALLDGFLDRYFPNPAAPVVPPDVPPDWPPSVAAPPVNPPLPPLLPPSPLPPLPTFEDLPSFGPPSLGVWAATDPQPAAIESITSAAPTLERLGFAFLFTCALLEWSTAVSAPFIGKAAQRRMK